ncbi:MULTISPECIES: FecCD family ABC transporter permease [Pseudothermotoga]|uniref:Transport system permease protein n=1 Tax=Pseudothermotoga lettingae (strain ATCC BAA-301 / DSM 14385 / NBRC 107922 / TMO) TaxID=416591 RepID=A8F6P8_PSELT|nr:MULTISPECIES: iron ABC transporter permease [Pseudothermotoga]ABV33832.1 transport system permease protein [Pseudothermotoga lettingae TMO]MDI3495629.1 cobalamin transport system permease protein [Pseudothermotoga sp.]MDK2884340.1 cobalamin transport system permease protein [Pseudothermotoga sp.]GLI49232.1 iron(III) ABC transporter permease [Pseudothermotoga lettingae TMO]
MKIFKIFSAIILLLFVAIVSTMFGGVHIPFRETIKSFFTADSEWKQIIWNIRFPRVLLSIVAGAGLAAVGGAFQGLLRNPLVDPYLLGVSSGASFGAVLSIFLADAYSISLIYKTPLISFVFALFAAIMTIVLSRRNGTTPITDLILSGVLISILFSSATVMLLMLVRKNITHAYVWLFGTLSGTGWDDLPVPLMATALFIFLSVGLSEQLNVISLGETQAKISGVNVEFVKFLIYIAGSFTTAAIVSVTGVIGFVGLITPHMTRRIFGSEHKTLIISSALTGGIFLCVCDAFARSIVRPSELPIGVITAFVGAPVMFTILKRSGSNG